MARAASSQTEYTYRNGKRVELKKRPDEFVVRRVPEEMPLNMVNIERVSGGSTRVKCAPKELEGLMTEARELAPTHHSYEVAESGQDFLITDRIIVTFHQAPDVDTLGAFLAKYALQVVQKYSDREYLLRLTDHTGMNPVKLVVKLNEEEQGLIESVDHDLNILASKMAITLPTDPAYAREWHLHRQLPAATDYDPRSSSRCEEAWQVLDNYGSSDVVVGITDDGCQLDHPDFDSANKFAGWGYFEGETLFKFGAAGANPTRMYQEGSDHGTACAGVIAAEVDSGLTVGAAPGCRLVPIKWESSGSSLFVSDSKLRTAVDYLADKVDVVSNSWGSSPASNFSTSLLNRIQALALTGGRRGRGIVFLWAAGNENCPISHTASQDVPYNQGWNNSFNAWIGVRTSRVFAHNLVGIPGVMHIAALGSTAQRSHYSNYGTGIGVCAPTSNSHEYLRLRLPGRGITATEGHSTVTDSFGGTSSATPLTAGIAALVVSANPQLSALDVIGVLKQTASKDLNMTGWPKTPAASFDPNPIWDVSPIAPFDSGAFQAIGLADGSWSPWFGHGKVDAVAAVRRALELGGTRMNRISATSATELLIPDNNPTGVVSRLSISEGGNIQNLSVTVNIVHTYIGDLEVRIVAPDGRRVLLHNRSGGNTANLAKTYDESTTSELAALRGSVLRGVWSLEIVDLAAKDSGRLTQWKIEADIASDGKLRKESAPNLAIPDNDPTGVSDSVTLADTRVISAIDVEVDITHTYIGDLRLELQGPTATIVLHDRAGGDADNIIRHYLPGDTPSLSTFVGQQAAGTWRLKVTDQAGRDVGKLNRWSLTLS